MKKLIAVSLVAFALAACGETRGDRALSGAAIGAGAGALGGAALGYDPLTGAVIGGAAGAAAGAVTEGNRNDRRYDDRRYRDRDGDGVPDRYDRFPRDPNRS
jgi:osmotically inducible lipoprotein OsmB